MSPDIKKKKKLLYVSDAGTEGHEKHGRIDIFSVPGYSLVGQIRKGVDGPDGLTVDKKGNLYVANGFNRTITVYKPGTTSPSLTLTQPKSYGPLDVAVGSNGYVYVSDTYGGVDVYPPGATSPSTRLHNPALTHAGGVAVDASNNVYADGTRNSTQGAVVKYANASVTGTNLGLTGLNYPAGVIIDKNKNVVVSDWGQSEILIYPPGKTSPSETIAVPFPDRSAINKSENLVFAPEGSYYYCPSCYFVVGVYDYPSGTLVTTIGIGGQATGAALSPAPTP
jgi:sugar lactone lactonase YvrE